MSTSVQVCRSFALDDIMIRSGGDGRTVEAYCAVFDTPAEITDRFGHYEEEIGRSSFTKTINDRGTRFGVFFNHGRTLFGTPSERGTMPIGSPIEPPRADGRGLLTVTRYNKTPQADDVLEAIRNGDITGQSFTGRIIRSSLPTPRGGFRPGAGGSLQRVVRQEIALIEYGPTPVPAYDTPMMVGVRSQLEHLFGADLGADLAAEDLLRMIAAASTRTGPDVAPGTPEAGAATEEPRQHSGRTASLRWRARQLGVL